IPLVSWLAAACGGEDEAAAPPAPPAPPAEPAEPAPAEPAPAEPPPAEPPPPAAEGGGTFRIGVQVPSAGLDPVLVADAGGLNVLGQTGQYLSLSLGTPELTPVLAESWEANADATVWTFKIRQGVTFNDEANTPMTAADVAATFNRLADPANKSNALSVFPGVFSGGGASAPDESTVVFELDAPNGSWPWLVSSDNYNGIILPENYAGDWEQTWIGTGPWKLESYTPAVGATLVRNENYWGEPALPDRVEITFYDDTAASILMLQGGQVDALDGVNVAPARAIIEDTANFTVLNIRASTHRQLSMRVDQEPFTDKRVRQAIALTLDRPAILEGLFLGLADIGNDSPFAPVFAATNADVPQRAKDIAMAKQLLADAGMGGGFKTKLNAIDTGEVPQYAQVVQSSAKEIGVDIELVIQDPSTYYGDAVFGSSPWLDSVMSLVDYGHRGVPNVLLGAPLLSDGVWNAAHFQNQQYDDLVRSFFAEPDITAQRDLAGQIQTLLLDETPIIFAYFYNSLAATASNVQGVVPTAINHLFVDRATKA
ncbi:MAG: ABC transporter substrate-binding protein, partial [Actinobacteria bacterium]|nr:ABC transporter substrate-binding protein [Actinomycetota bacterium]